MEDNKSLNDEKNKWEIVRIISRKGLWYTNPIMKYLHDVIAEYYTHCPNFPTMYSDETSDLSNRVKEFLVNLVRSRQQPTANELLEQIESKFGLKARWSLVAVINGLMNDPDLTVQERGYFRSMIESGSLADALRGQEGKGPTGWLND